MRAGRRIGGRGRVQGQAVCSVPSRRRRRTALVLGQRARLCGPCRRSGPRDLPRRPDAPGAWNLLSNVWERALIRLPHGHGRSKGPARAIRSDGESSEDCGEGGRRCHREEMTRVDPDDRGRIRKVAHHHLLCFGGHRTIVLIQDVHDRDPGDGRPVHGLEVVVHGVRYATDRIDHVGQGLVIERVPAVCVAERLRILGGTGSVMDVPSCSATARARSRPSR